MIALTNDQIAVQIAPEVGARITSFVDKPSGYEFLWRNNALPLRLEEKGAAYDPNFYGGIDELLPNDMPEMIEGCDCPDHGELWTTPFTVLNATETELTLAATLTGVQFEIHRRIALKGNACHVTTRLTNHATVNRPFMWKLHAALAILPCDQVLCEATSYTAADADWSRRKDSGEWHGETVPDFDGTTEFLYLHGLRSGSIGWQREGKSFAVEFDRAVFPYAWYFASYGGFDGHHVAVLEPCTCMPISVNEAHAFGQCSVLTAGASLETGYIYRGTVVEG